MFSLAARTAGWPKTFGLPVSPSLLASIWPFLYFIYYHICLPCFIHWERSVVYSLAPSTVSGTLYELALISEWTDGSSSTQLSLPGWAPSLWNCLACFSPHYYLKFKCLEAQILSSLIVNIQLYLIIDILNLRERNLGYENPIETGWELLLFIDEKLSECLT